MTSFGPHLLLILAIGLHLKDVSSWSFTPVTESFTAYENPDSSGSINFMCQADTPLVKCQYNLIPLEVQEDYKHIDLSQGVNSGVVTRKNPPLNNETLFDVSYNGTGLEHGQCGATFTNVRVKSYHFGCRGADAAGTWHDMDFTILDHLAGPEESHTTISPREVVAMPGSDVSMLLKTNLTLGRCLVKFEEKPDAAHGYYDEGEFKTFPTNYRYYGSSPSEGECGITLLNVSDDDNGPISHAGWTTEGKLVHRISTVIVASPPTETYLNVDKLKYSVGDTLKATCSSLLSRPVANLTWTLDDRIIRQDGIDDEFQEDVWSWPWDKKNITQKLSLKLEEENFGKKLECSVQHLALTNQQSDFHYLITKV